MELSSCCHNDKTCNEKEGDLHPKSHHSDMREQAYQFMINSVHIGMSSSFMNGMALTLVFCHPKSSLASKLGPRICR